MDFLNQKRMKDLSVLAVAVVLVQIVLSRWVYPLFNTTTQQAFSITPQTAVTSPTVGNSVLGFLSGIFPFNLGDFTIWVAMFIGTFVILFLGYWAYEQKWAWKGKNMTQRLFAILFYGTAVLYVFLLVTKMQAVATLAVPLLIGLTINYFIIAFVITQAAKSFKILRI